MTDYQAYFKGKKITVMGLGLLGRGVGDAQFLAEQGAELIVTDLKNEEELMSSVAQLKDFPNVTFVLGEHRMEDFQNRDYILKAAGVPLDSPYIEEAKKNGIQIKMSASWFQELTDVPVVGVTGTRGKSTVTHMLYEILKTGGKHVLLGGNVRGVSTLSLLSEVTEDSIALFELDSWQLQGFGDAKTSPNIAVFTTFFDDHLNYYLRTSEGNSKAGLDISERGTEASSAYKEAMKQYLEDKAQIFLHQKPEDVLVVSEQILQYIEVYKNQIQSRMNVVPQLDIMLQIPGEHNKVNAALAQGAARAIGVDDHTITDALVQFKGVPGRLELIREVRGVKFYNDTTATTPEATMAALRALDPEEKKNIILIMGGADKELDMNRLLVEIPKYAKRVLLLAGTGTSRVLPHLEGASVFDSFEAAFVEAVSTVKEREIILLSPAFASFGMFKNEFDRGDQFNALVQKL